MTTTPAIPDPACAETLEALRDAARRARSEAAHPPDVLFGGADPDLPAPCAMRRLLDLLRRGNRPCPKLHRPGSPELSFDEAWCLALFSAMARRDVSSARFLLARRLPAPMIPAALALAARIIAPYRAYS